MNVESLISRIEGHHAAHLHCHVLVDPLAIAGQSDHALLAHLREALGEAALMRVDRADLAHVPHPASRVGLPGFTRNVAQP
ncbi:hypothetical protein PPTS312_31960 [Pseudomonas putida]|uniref:Uncharacterized protein n=1 Tax=Pseudomonas putida TaxID=303 RepID=A0A7U6M3J2_PSEPU|nr:hypothetical protein [Pseudomonas putida]BBU45281.1 hypothetical protein PPTS312_31960 [Pseudomonas putida]